MVLPLWRSYSKDDTPIEEASCIQYANFSLHDHCKQVNSIETHIENFAMRLMDIFSSSIFCINLIKMINMSYIQIDYRRIGL